MNRRRNKVGTREKFSAKERKDRDRAGYSQTAAGVSVRIIADDGAIFHLGIITIEYSAAITAATERAIVGV